MKRYLIQHDRRVTLDLVDEEGTLTVERFQSGKRERLTVDQFERSNEGRSLASKLREALARAKRG